MNKKTYRVSIIDWNINKVATQKYICGLADVRKTFPDIHFHYSRGYHAWVAYDNNYEYIAVEC